MLHSKTDPCVVQTTSRIFAFINTVWSQCVSNASYSRIHPSERPCCDTHQGWSLQLSSLLKQTTGITSVAPKKKNLYWALGLQLISDYSPNLSGCCHLEASGAAQHPPLRTENVEIRLINGTASLLQRMFWISRTIN